jgi:hypothetical protein
MNKYLTKIAFDAARPKLKDLDDPSYARIAGKAMLYSTGGHILGSIAGSPAGRVGVLAGALAGEVIGGIQGAKSSIRNQHTEQETQKAIMFKKLHDMKNKELKG